MSTLIQSLVASTLAVTRSDAAVVNVQRALAPTSFYVDTLLRRKMRALLDGAADTGSTVKIGFIKIGGDTRYMMARPLASVDGTSKYYTVIDLELSEAAGCEQYRRVNLDMILAASVVFNAAEALAA